ncbi:MAG TPA: multicopper oxidase domain-containing protein [Symbiobacteriaceae bacterium]|nr:multicopper oxidase domain-containing protein [Symbiobacteriaceae bacterium]
MSRRIALMLVGLLVATSALTGSALADEAPKPITPEWRIEDVVQQMRDEYQGGTVMPQERTGQVRDFHLHIAEFEHEITEGVKVKAWGSGFEGQPVSVPGPTLRAKQGDLVRIHLKNETDQPHSLHSHGITSVDEVNDGVPHVTGAYIMPGETFTYQFVANEAGTHWYHCHVQTSLHQDMGMYGALIIEDVAKPTWDREFVMMVDEWDTHRDPADAVTKPTWNYFVVNGKAGKSVPDMIIPEGEIARIRLINAGFESHALHLHGTHFVITHKDGYQLPLPQRADTLNIAPGETYDVLVKGRDGVFPWHDHNSLAVTDDGVYPGGMLMHTRGSAARRFDPAQTFEPLPLEGEIHNQGHHPGDEGHVIDHDDHVMVVPKNGAAPVVTPNAVLPETTFGQAVAFDPAAPAPFGAVGGVVEVRLEARRVNMEVAPGDVREVWTFGGQVPAPTIRVRQGDTVRITLVNKDPEMEHGLDFHAGQMDSGTFHQAIGPGESITFDYMARYPGVFYYHCSAGPVIMHIANGMFGAMIVDPPGYTPAGREYVLVQHEWYDPAGGLEALLTGQPTSVVLNGAAAQYVDRPLTAGAGEKVRFYFVNAGANNFAGFHVIGEIFDAVFSDGNPRNVRRGVQTVTVPPGGAVVTEMVAAAGSYPLLTHSMGDATMGALGVLRVDPPAFGGVRVLCDGVDLSASARLSEGRTYVSAAAFAAAAHVDFAFDPGSGRVMVAGKGVAAEVDGFVWVRELAAVVGAVVEWDASSWTVVVVPAG